MLKFAFNLLLKSSIAAVKPEAHTERTNNLWAWEDTLLSDQRASPWAFVSSPPKRKTDCGPRVLDSISQIIPNIPLEFESPIRTTHLRLLKHCASRSLCSLLSSSNSPARMGSISQLDDSNLRVRLFQKPFNMSIPKHGSSLLMRLKTRVSCSWCLLRASLCLIAYSLAFQIRLAVGDLGSDESPQKSKTKQKRKYVVKIVEWKYRYSRRQAHFDRAQGFLRRYSSIVCDPSRLSSERSRY